MTPAEAGRPDEDEPGPEDPTRFGRTAEVEPLDEAPEGHTPMESNDASEDSLPPGAHQSEP